MFDYNYMKENSFKKWIHCNVNVKQMTCHSSTQFAKCISLYKQILYHDYTLEATLQQRKWYRTTLK